MSRNNTATFTGWLAAAALLASPAAFAHVGHDDTHGFISGFSHPFSGWDHVLAMVAVGIWAAQLGQRAVWALPLAFPLLMVLGGMAGVAELGLPGIEAGIALSSIVLGVLVLANVQMQVVLAAVLVGALALFHGYAHGTELPASANGLHYGMGFVLGTLLLHVTGILLGLLHKTSAGSLVLRAMGAGIAGTGALFLAAALG